MQTIWNMIGASVVGTSHTKTDVPCQDAHGYTLLENGVFLLAVADGAGSATFSEYGSGQVVNTALNFLESVLTDVIPDSADAWQHLLRVAFSMARNSLVTLAEEGEHPLREFATTLTLVAGDHQWIATGQIGDGIVVSRGSDGALTPLTRPQSGEFAGETYFLTMDNALDFVDHQVYQTSVEAIAAMTDGLYRLAVNVPTGEPHPPFFTPLFQFAQTMSEAENAKPHLEAFLNTERINHRTDDDKTIVLVVRPIIKHD